MTDSLEALPEYVERIMQEKGLKPKDIEIRSGKKIDAAYVFKILHGRSKYPSVVKLQALAEGLGVDEDELFKVARGVPVKGKYRRGGEPWPGPLLVKALGRIVSSPELTEIVKALLEAKPAKIKAVKKVLDLGTDS
jgi:transcriptional regulator with XRE-family HTH domain